MNKKKRSKKPNFGRSKFLYISLVLLLFGFLSYLSFSHFYRLEPKDVPNLKTKIDKKSQKDKNITEKEFRKEKYKYSIKFNKDENLTKIFIDSKKADETESLNQKEPKKAEIKKQVKEIDKNKTLEVNITKPNFESKELKNEEKNTTQTIKKDEILKLKEQGEKKVGIYKKSPKLVIIIDDVANKKHTDMIRSTKLKLTPSFFPKTKHHPDTPKLAMGFEFYMIHLPMEANEFKAEEIGTLKVNEKYESIEKKIARIRADFPNVKFINNHTGSRFTSDFQAMDKAYKAFLKFGFIFMDSKTIATSKVREVAKKNAKPYIVRDVFLDDKDDKFNIKKSLDLAINTAKRNGYAIAIGHPRKNTIEVLKQNRDHILNNVELVYLKDVYGFYR